MTHRYFALGFVAIASSVMISCKPIDPNIAIQGKVNNSGQIAEYTEGIRKDPNNDNAYYNRGLEKHRLEDYQGALADYNEAIRINPSDSASADYYLNRGLTKRELGDKQGAKTDYEKAIALERKNDSISSDSLRNLGIVESELGNKQAAISTLRLAAQGYQDNVQNIAKMGDVPFHRELSERQKDKYRDTLLLIQKIEKQP